MATNSNQQPVYCAIQWLDTDEFDVIQSICIDSNEDELILNDSYFITKDSRQCYATILAIGSKQDCDSFLQTQNSDDTITTSTESSIDNKSQEISKWQIVRILMKLIKDAKSIEHARIHNVQCSICHHDIDQIDRYHCLECPINFDLCGICFEKHRQTDQHSSGHALIHMKLPDELLGISIKQFRDDLTLNRIKQIDQLRDEQHDGISCDGYCHQSSIHGLRFKCDTCPHYNLCEECAIKNHCHTKQHENTHPIILTSMNAIPKIDPDDIQLNEYLGKGAFGEVRSANWKSKNQQVACKILRIKNIASRSLELRQSFLRELAAYRELSGPNILQIYGYSRRDLPGNPTHLPETEYMIVMEFMAHGSLKNFLKDHPKEVSLRRKLTMARQIASGMKRIHQHRMIHRDIRPDNILVTNNIEAKIGDMGIARELDPFCQHTQIGCRDYMPPEFFQGSFDNKLDIFTYGLTINFLLTEVTHGIRETKHHSEIVITPQSPIFYNELIAKCLDPNPRRRPTADQIEQFLLLYHQSFNKTISMQKFKELTIQQKDELFLRFYHKNQSLISDIINERLFF